MGEATPALDKWRKGGDIKSAGELGLDALRAYVCFGNCIAIKWIERDGRVTDRSDRPGSQGSSRSKMLKTSAG